MWNYKKSVKLSLYVCYLLSILLLVLLIAGPIILDTYLSNYRGFTPNGEAIKDIKLVFGCVFYPSSIFAGIILYSLIKLLNNINKNEILTRVNSAILRLVSWCCFIIALITLVGGLFYMPFIFISLAGGFVGIMLRVLKNVMQTAAEIREENDLTI